MRIARRHRREMRARGGGIEGDQFAHRVPARSEIAGRGFGGEKRRGVGAAEVAEQGQRHGAKAAVAARGADMDQPAARDVIGADRKRRRRLDGEFEQQHVAAGIGEAVALARGVELEQLAGTERARRVAVARRGGGGGEAARFLGGADGDLVRDERGAAACEDADRGAAGDEDGGRGRRDAAARRADEKRQPNAAAIGEDEPARAAITAADEPQRRAREGVGGDKRERGVEPDPQPRRVGKPGEEARDRDRGRFALGRVDRGEQAAGRAIGAAPCRVVGGDRFADALAARGVGAGGNGRGASGRRSCEKRGSRRRNAPPAPARDQSWTISAMVTAISKTDGPDVTLSPISDPNNPTAVSSNGSAAISMGGSSIFPLLS